MIKTIKIRRNITALLLAMIMLVGCTSTRKPYEIGSKSYGQTAKGYSYVVKGIRYTTKTAEQAKNYNKEGVASYYHRKFNGRKTASGERYNPALFTAAHKTLPINSYVLVTNLENNKQVVVRINDRGPFVKGRIIDLSKAAAKEIGLTAQGLGQVKVEGLQVNQLTQPLRKQ